MKYPLMIVCAGAGYGKTTAILDFLKEYKATTVWVQLSERDNVGGRFWENFTYSMTQISATFGLSIKKLGFPDTAEKLKQFHSYMNAHEDKKRRLIVFDDCHCIENPAVIKFVEEAIRCLPIGISLILISRSTPPINIAGLLSADLVFNVSEDELRFTESELARYFRNHGITLQPDSLHSLMQDTEGWAFALNYAARSYRNAPGYEGYLRNALKSNIFRFMEIEVWNITNKRLQNFLVRLSLIDHLSVDLIALLAGKDKELIKELEHRHAYVRRDRYINAYLIHPLFLEFLATKQDILSQEEKHETYTIAGVWCNQNGFKIDALSYYEKIGDYKAIVYMFLGSVSQIPHDIACYGAAVLERAPQEAFDTVTYLASTHIRIIMSQGLFDEADKKAAYYEARYINLPMDDPFRKSTLGSIYYCWAVTRASMYVINDICDFDLYYEKLKKCYSKPIDPGNLIARTPGPWICAVGSSRKGSVDDFIATMKRSISHVSECFIGFETEEDKLALGEFKFYQGDIPEAETFIARGMTRAREMRRSEIVHRALFLTLRIAILQGDYKKVQQTLKDLKANHTEVNYANRFIDYDISLCWYYCTLGMPEKAPDWFKEEFSLYGYAGFIENYANQMKGRYCYVARNYPLLLSYIQDMKMRESYLFGRVEMLAMEACIQYKLKQKEKAYAAFKEAYDAALPNNIIMPFIELGKDMRTLTAFILKKPGKIPKSWLEIINRKSASYAKRLAHIIAEYKQSSGMTGGIAISPKEREILTDLSHGLSRTEIAVNRNLSINTIKMRISNIYIKLGAENMADAIRIATERKIL